jgi:hypothetical protein
MSDQNCIESLLRKHDPLKNNTIIKISEHSNIGSNYRDFILIIRLTVSIIDYRTAGGRKNGFFLEKQKTL